MAIQQILKVWEHELPHNEQAVALAMADHANEDGTGMWPSNKRIAHKTGYKKRSVQSIKKKMRERGLLVRVKKATRYRPTEYRFDWSKVDEKPPFEDSKQGCKSCTPDESEGDQGCTHDHPRDDEACVSGVHASSPKPSLNPQARERANPPKESPSLRSGGQSPKVPTLFADTEQENVSGEEDEPQPSKEEPDVIEVEAEEESRARVEDFRAAGMGAAADAFEDCDGKQGENYFSAVVFRDLFAPGEEPRKYIGRLAKMRQMLVGEKIEGEKLDRAAAGQVLIASMYQTSWLEDFEWTKNSESMKALPKRALNYITKVISNRKEENTDAADREKQRTEVFGALDQLGKELRQHAGAGAGAAK